MRTYKTNAELQQLLNAAEVTHPGYEITLEAGRHVWFGSGKHLQKVTAVSSVVFWPTFFAQGRIIDRTDGSKATRRGVALVAQTASGSWVYRTNPGTTGAIRYGYARTENEALADIHAWIKRRFAFVTFAA